MTDQQRAAIKGHVHAQIADILSVCNDDELQEFASEMNALFEEFEQAMGQAPEPKSDDEIELENLLEDDEPDSDRERKIDEMVAGAQVFNMPDGVQIAIIG